MENEVAAPPEHEGEAKPEGKKLDKEGAEFVGWKVVALVTALGLDGFARKADFQLALTALQNQASRYDAIGAIFDPVGHASKRKFFAQGIKKLKAIILLIEACWELEEVNDLKQNEQKFRDQMRQILGL